MGSYSFANTTMVRPRRRSRLRKVILAICLIVIVGVWATSLYQVVAGQVIEARVLSCAYRSCEVAWSYGNAHGIDSTDSVGGTPGGLMQVTYVPGWGVTNLDTAVITIVLVPGAALIVWVKVLVQRRRRARTACS